MDGRRNRRFKSEPQPSGDGAGCRWRNHPRNVGGNNLRQVNNAKLRRKLKAQVYNPEMARLKANIKMMRKLEMQAMARVDTEARRQEALRVAEEQRIKRAQIKLMEQEKRIKCIQQLRMKMECHAQQLLEDQERQRMHDAMLMQQDADARRQDLMQKAAVEVRKKSELRRLELEKAKELKEPIGDMSLADLKDNAQFPRQNRTAGGGKRGRAQSCGFCSKKAKLA